MLGLLAGISAAALQAQREEQQDFFEKWLEQDVVYIISAEEQDVFRKLTTDEERERFIEQFWQRRDPNPGTVINEFREEHYRRIQYANERFASGIPGWKTDRGRIYIKFGPADQVTAHASGGHYQRPFWEGGGSTSTFPFEVWRYRHIEGVGQDVELEFVDDSLSGEYRLTTNPHAKDALLHAGGAGPTLAEQLGMSSKADRIRQLTNPSPRHNMYGFGYGRLKDQPFEKLLLLTNLERPPRLGTPKLREFVQTKIHYRPLPFQLRSDYLRVDQENYLVLLTIKIHNRELQYVGKGDRHRTVVHIYGELVDVAGAVAQSFEESVASEIPDRRLVQELQNFSLYQKSIQLRPGRYKLQLAVENEAGEKLGVITHLVVVPRIDETTVATSTLVPALRIEPLEESDSRQFVMGPLRVFPDPESRIQQGKRLPLFFQIYNLAVDQSSGSPLVDVEYILSGPGREIRRETDRIRGLQGPTISVVKFVSTEALPAGDYSLEVHIIDNLSGVTIRRRMPFRVVG